MSSVKTFRRRRAIRRKRLRKRDIMFLRRLIGFSAVDMLVADELLIERGHPSILSPTLRAAVRVLVDYANEVNREANS